MSNRVLVITGPTAAGKSSVALELCRHLDGEIVNADAMQVYRGMDIGTAKSSPAERKEVPHHLIDIRSPSESYSVADYVRDAALAIRDIHLRGHLAVVCGGTGLYVQSLMEGIQFHPHSYNPEVRRELEEQADREGVAALRRQLQEMDPESASRLTDGDRRRVIRALEMIRTTGSTPTVLREQSRLEGPSFDFSAFCLTLERPLLYARIEARIDRMFEAGLPQEATSVLSNQPGPTARQAIGYKEFAPWLAGEQDLTQVAEQIKIATRHYAKRQLTWFRRMPTLVWIDNAEPQKMMEILKRA